jgi:hypothetical protein
LKAYKNKQNPFYSTASAQSNTNFKAQMDYKNYEYNVGFQYASFNNSVAAGGQMI